MTARKRLLALLCVALSLAEGMAACGATGVSTSSFKGEAHAVAQAISDLQSDVTAGDQHKVCSGDLARAIVARLNAARGGCSEAIKHQLAEIDNPEVSVKTVQVSGTSASASVKSVFSGKSRLATLTLVKEGGRWRILSLQG
jgi:Putative lumazine-binding